MDHSSSLLTSLLSSFLKSVLYIATRMSFGSRKPSLITLLPESTQWLPATQNWRERYYNGLMSGLLFTFLNSSPPTLPFSLSLQPHFLSIFIFFKRKKKKRTQNSKSYFFPQDLWFWSLYWAHSSGRLSMALHSVLCSVFTLDCSKG